MLLISPEQARERNAHALEMEQHVLDCFAGPYVNAQTGPTWFARITCKKQRGPA